MDFKKPTILVVDDEEKNLRLADAILTPLGYRVIKGCDGGKAIHKAREESPDVILLDIMMPKLDGFEVCRQLKRSTKTAPVPVIMVTALNDRDSRIKGFMAGAHDFVSKPFDKQEIVLRIKNALYTKGLFDLLVNYYHKSKTCKEVRQLSNK